VVRLADPPWQRTDEEDFYNGVLYRAWEQRNRPLRRALAAGPPGPEPTPATSGALEAQPDRAARTLVL